MSNNFRGYLFASVKNGSVTPFPSEFIQLGTWTSSPNVREELKAVRDDNTRNLTRVTAKGRKSSFSFKTRKNLHLDEKIRIQKFFTDAEIDSDQRKINLRFWNDEDNAYKDGTFYRPNTEFPILRITQTDIIYDELEIKGVEY